MNYEKQKKENIIEIIDVTKTYPIYEKKSDRVKESLDFRRKKYHRDFNALNKVNFSLIKGETLGIIGQNGSGKSTLLKIITGVLTQTTGEVNVYGKVSALLELGAGFNLEMTGLENIYLNGTLMGYTKEEMDNRLSDIITFADIGDFMYQPVKMYSSGMFARLAFAVAVNVDPDILIVDEALSVGDIYFQNKCFQKMEEFKKRGITVIIVSHDIATIKQMSDKVLWLDSGNMIGFGHKNDLCEQYLSHQIKRNSQYNKNITLEKNNSKIKNIDVINDLTIFPNNAIASKNDIVSNDAKILSFYITNFDGEMCNYLTTKNSYDFHIVAKFSKALSDVIFGFTMENKKGFSILSMNTFMSENKKTYDVEAGQVMKVTFRIQLPQLLQDEYLLSPAIALGTQKNHQTLTWLHNNSMITIENAGYNISLLEISSETTSAVYNNIELI